MIGYENALLGEFILHPNDIGNGESKQNRNPSPNPS